MMSQWNSLGTTLIYTIPVIRSRSDYSPRLKIGQILNWVSRCCLFVAPRFPMWIDPAYKIEAWCWLVAGFLLGIIFMFVVRM